MSLFLTFGLSKFQCKTQNWFFFQLKNVLKVKKTMTGLLKTVIWAVVMAIIYCEHREKSKLFASFGTLSP